MWFITNQNRMMEDTLAFNKHESIKTLLFLISLRAYSLSETLSP
jgi:hypothetical protein